MTHPIRNKTQIQNGNLKCFSRFQLFLQPPLHPSVLLQCIETGRIETTILSPISCLRLAEKKLQKLDYKIPSHLSSLTLQKHIDWEEDLTAPSISLLVEDLTTWDGDQTVSSLQQLDRVHPPHALSRHSPNWWLSSGSREGPLDRVHQSRDICWMNDVDDIYIYWGSWIINILEVIMVKIMMKVMTKI